MSNFGTTDFLIEVAKGNIDGHEIKNIAAANPLVGTTIEDVWDAGGVLVYPATNESWEIVSDDATDTAAGVGAQEITIRYMDDTHVEQTPVVLATSGTSSVSLGVSNCFRMIEMTVTSIGSSLGNAGNVTLRVASAGATRGQINFDSANSIAENQAQDSHYTVPAGKTAFMLSFYNEINKNEDIKFRIRQTDGANGIFRTIVTTSLYQDQFGMTLRAPGTQLEEKTDFKIICVSSNTNAIGSIVVQFLVVDNQFLGG